MNTLAHKTQENNSQSFANTVSKKQRNSESTFQFVDNRSEAIAQSKLQEIADNSPRVAQLGAFQEVANNSNSRKLTLNNDAQAGSPLKKTKHSNTALYPIQKTAKNVSDDIKKDKYPYLKTWYTQLKKAADGSGSTKALTDMIYFIIDAVKTQDISVQRNVYDDLRKLINRYNNSNSRFRIDLGIVPSLQPRAIQTTSEYLSYPDSPTQSGLTQEEAFNSYTQIFSNTSQIVLRDQKSKSQTIPVVDSFAKAGRAIRLQQYAKESIAPIPFSVQQGDIHTLFEYRNDYIANPLRTLGNAYIRDGQIGSWNAIISNIDSTTTIQDIINIINGAVSTQPTQIQLEVAGAMIADTKNGITNWITIMNDLPADTTIKNLLSTDYKGFVDSRSYKTQKPFTGPETSLRMMVQEDEDTSMEDILDDWPEQTANQVLLRNIQNADDLRLAASQISSAIETAMGMDERLEEVTSDFVSETVLAYSRTIGLNSELTEILDFLVAELVYDEDYSEALNELSENPKYSKYISDLQK